MSLEFHYEDRPPQQWLDELYNMQIPRLWDIKLNDTQRGNLMTRAKQQIKDWRAALREQIKKIEARYPQKEQSEEKRLMTAPYQKLDALCVEIIDALADLEVKLAAKRPIPEGFELGDRIFGSLDTGRWYFGGLRDLKRYEEFEKLERRYLGLRREYGNLGQEVKVAYDRANDQQRELKKTQKQYRQLKGFWQLGLRVLIVIIVVVFSLVLGGFVFVYDKRLLEDGMSNQTFGIVMMLIGVIGAVVAIVLARRRRRAIANLEEDINTMKASLTRLKKEALRQKKLFYPTETTFKEISIEYKKMKQTFES